MKYTHVHTLFLMLVLCTSCKGQGKTNLPKDTISSESKDVITSHGPTTSVRTITQDRQGNIWLASNEGIIRYDGKTFTNITGNLGSDRFFYVLQDRNENFWFGNYGSGAYYYPSASLRAGGKSLQHFTTKEGLVSNGIFSIYEDKAGNIWFGSNGGVSCYDGISFRNYVMKGDTMIEDKTGTSFPHFTSGSNGVSSIIEDKTGKFWFGTNGHTFIYDGRTFAVLRDNEGKAINNVWSIIEDKKGNIWLGGDGLWRYDGSTVTNFSENNIRYLCEDKGGNIWGSGSVNGKWALYRFDQKALLNKKPTVIEIAESLNLFGVFAANDGNIWFGSFDGVYRYDGNTITDFKNKDSH